MNLQSRWFFFTPFFTNHHRATLSVSTLAFYSDTVVLIEASGKAVFAAETNNDSLSSSSSPTWR